MVVSFWADSDIDKVKNFVAENEITWSHHILFSWGKEEGVIAKYRVGMIPSAYIIDEKGRLAAKALRGDKGALDALNNIFKNK